MLRIDAVWLSVEPLDMRAGTETVLARVIKAFREARTHHAYLFANQHANRVKVLVQDGIGVWLCARRLQQGSFTSASAGSGPTVSLSAEQLGALAIGPPWLGSETARRPASRDSVRCRAALRCGTIAAMDSDDRLGRMDAEGLRECAAALIDKLARKGDEIARLAAGNRLKQFEIDSSRTRWRCRNT